jgi:hypothetical protein
VISCEIQAGDGSWVKAPFLVDTAADRMVFSARILGALNLPTSIPPHRLGGVGDEAVTVVVETQLRMTHEENRKAVCRGQFAAFTELEVLDMSVLGRDITNLFAVIVDRPRDFVCLLGQRHQYTILQS